MSADILTVNKKGEWPGNILKMSPEITQCHDDLCDMLELHGHSEADVVTMSVGIWAGLYFAEKALEKLKTAVGALEFYADEDHWSAASSTSCPAILMGEDIETTHYNTSKFSGGKIARTALAEINKP